MTDRKVKAKRERQRKRRAAKQAPKQERKLVLISSAVLAKAQEKKRRSQKREVNAFVIPQFPPGVAPSKDSGLAMDSDLNLSGALAWAEGSGLFSDNLQFLGYPYLAELAQRPEYRMVSERLAIEMTRKWIKFQSINTEEDKTQQIKELNDAFTKFKVSDKFLTLAEQDGFFGRSHLFADIGDQTDKEELKTSIGDGTTRLSQQKVRKGSLKRLTVVEPVWCYPTNYNSNNPIDPTWYNPEHWLMMGTQVHSTRLLRFVGRDIPDMLKPAYAFGGLSMSQMIKPYVDKWLRNVNSVSDLLDMFSITVLKTDLNAQLSGTSENFFNRMDLFNAMRDNRGLFAVDKNNEDLINLSTPLGTLDTLQAASLEHIAAVAHLPLIIMLGIQPAGLNASSEGEIRAFYDWVNAFQIKFFGPGLTRVMHIIMLHLWGKIDKGITYSFEPLWSVDEVQLATKRKSEADTDVAYVEGGILSEEEVRKRIASDPSTPYQGLDVSAVPEPSEEEGEGGETPIPGEEQDPQPEDGEAGEKERVIPFGEKRTANDEVKFEESKHPRANNGQFGSGGGGASETHPDKKANHSSQVPFVELRTKLKTMQPGDAKTSVARQLVHGYVLKIKELIKSGKQVSAEKASKKAIKYSKHLPGKEKNELHSSLASTLKGGESAAPKKSVFLSDTPAPKNVDEYIAQMKELHAGNVKENEGKIVQLMNNNPEEWLYAYQDTDPDNDAQGEYAEGPEDKEKAPAPKPVAASPSPAATGSAYSKEETAFFKDLGGLEGEATAKSLSLKAKSKLATIKDGKLGSLTPAAAAHILAYSGSSYVGTNEALRAGVMNEAQWGHVRSLNKALDMLPDHVGTVYRKATMDPQTASLYKPGMIVEERGFTSTSKNSEKWHGNLRFEITSKTGKDISRMSLHPGEAEVLFQSGSRFKIISRDGGKIKMEQVE